MYEEIKHKINLYRRFRYWSKAECIFIHVPKAAGTSISRALYGRTLGHYTAREISEAFPGLYEKAFTFSLVRNPWDRVLSAYRFACVGKTESMGIYRPEQYRVPEFESFERFVLDWLPYKNIGKIDFVFRPQNRFVCWSDSSLAVDYLGRVEELDKNFEYISGQIGRSVKVSRFNATQDAGRDFRFEYKSNEMIEMVRNVYLEDISLFGYDFE